MILTSTDLVTSIASRGLFPRSQQTFSDSDILRFANEELSNDVVPLVVHHNEEYYVREIAIPLIPGRDRYRIPGRALGGKLRSLHYVDASGNSNPLPKIAREALHLHPVSSDRPVGFYIQGNDIRTVPSRITGTGLTLVAAIHMRPNRIVPLNRCRKVVSATPSSVTLTSVPPHLKAGERIDVLSRHAGTETKYFDVAIVGVVGQTLLLSADALGDDIEIGDWVALADETPIPQCPEELHTFLLELTSVRILQALNNTAAIQLKQPGIDRMRAQIGNLIDNRVVGNPTKFVNKNSLLRTRRRAF